jgi:N6-adenosine-specific RNA methylase IME4
VPSLSPLDGGGSGAPRSRRANAILATRLALANRNHAPPTDRKTAMTSTERARRRRARLKKEASRAAKLKKSEKKRERRAERELAMATATAIAAANLGEELFGVLYVDPPSDFQVWDAETGMDRHAANHYPVMSDEEIAALKLPAAKDCVLFLWSTRPKLAYAIAVLLPAWGFTYKTCSVWKKEGRGTGYWFIDDAEILIVATRGKVVAPAPGTQYRSTFEAPAGKHSEKPEAFAEMITEYFPTMPKLEMFYRADDDPEIERARRARRQRAGWTMWGNETE